jgi:Uma2 family endonuclease
MEAAMSGIATFLKPGVVDTGMERRLWTIDEYHRFADLGLFTPEERLELIRGEIIKKITQRSPHATATQLVAQALEQIRAVACVIRQQLPITLPEHSEPEPDVVVARGSIRDYEDRHPGPGDVLLVVEVSDTTIIADSTSKAALYAEFCIPEYWNLNLRERMLAVCREPVPMPSSEYGFEYRSITLLNESDSLSPAFEPGLVILVVDLLPRIKPSEQ